MLGLQAPQALKASKEFRELLALPVRKVMLGQLVLPGLRETQGFKALLVQLALKG
jgi:hypothetical protein